MEKYFENEETINQETINQAIEKNNISFFKEYSEVKEPEELAAELFNVIFSNYEYSINWEFKKLKRYNNSNYLYFYFLGEYTTIELIPWEAPEELTAEEVYEATIKNYCNYIHIAEEEGGINIAEVIEQLENIMKNKEEFLEYIEKALTAWVELTELIQLIINNELEGEGKIEEYALLYNL